jgi:hypothetical protein
VVQQTQVLRAEQRYMRDKDEVGGLDMGPGSISLLQLQYSLALTVHDWTMTNEVGFYAARLMEIGGHSFHGR